MIEEEDISLKELKELIEKVEKGNDSQIGAVEVFTYDLSQGPFFERFFAYNSKILIGFTICFV